MKVMNIIHDSVVDGEGLRTVIFLQAARTSARDAIIREVGISIMEQRCQLKK